MSGRASKSKFLSLLLSALAMTLLGCVEHVSAAWSVANAFTNLSFTTPVFLTPEPRSSRLYVCELGGRIFFFTNDPAIAYRGHAYVQSAVAVYGARWLGRRRPLIRTGVD